jgi:cobalt-zinc-cadmium efflux system membrane fusion protein
VVKPDATKVAEVRSLTRGRMTSVEATVGDRVTRNQVLAEYDDIELGDLISQRAAAVAALRRAEIESRVAREAVDRARALVEVGALAEAERQRREAELDRANTQIEEAETSVEQINRKLRLLGVNEDTADGTVNRVDTERTLITRITAPIGGVVTEAEVVSGEVVESTDILFRIADLSDVWVQGNLQEKDIGLVRTGMPVTVSVIAFPERKFDGRVTYLGDLVNPESRTLPVRCVVDNPGWRLKLDMFATVSISVQEDRPVLAVPSASIQEIDGRTAVFVQRSPTRFEVQEVDLGARGSGWIEISRGLSQGEYVASAGSFQLKSVLLRDSLAEED